MLAVIRIRGRVGVDVRIKKALNMMGLTKLYSLCLLDEKQKRMMNNVVDYVAWGETNESVLHELKKRMGDKKILHLSPPKGGFKGIKLVYPKGDLGYRGEKINDLIKRMIK
ncbi:uL30 family ribosomal protein [Candidatus Woesearchaeota archaeon]|nr:uL30 family ribosomal protein [Candidatus Woesearchaeota archaeon]